MKYRNLHYSFFLTSFFLHIIAVIALVWANASDDLKKPFIVFGAYSKKPTKVFFGTPHGRPHGHGTKRKGFSESKPHKGRGPESKKVSGGVGLNKKTTAKITEKKGTRGKKETSNHDMRAASKLGKHGKKKCIKSSGFTAIPEPEAKVTLKEKQKEILRKKKEKEHKEEEQQRKAQEQRERESQRKQIEAELERKQAEEQKNRELKDELEQKEREQRQLAEIKQLTENNQEAELGTDDADDDEVIDDDQDDDGDDEEEGLEFNLIGPDHADWAVYQKDIQKEVARLWHPPLGVPRGTVCKIKFRVDQEGKIESFELVGHSKMLIYDLSIVRVAKNFKFEKRLWGKEFIIGFRQ